MCVHVSCVIHVYTCRALSDFDGDNFRTNPFLSQKISLGGFIDVDLLNYFGIINYILISCPKPNPLRTICRVSVMRGEVQIRSFEPIFKTIGLHLAL